MKFSHLIVLLQTLVFCSQASHAQGERDSLVTVNFSRFFDEGFFVCEDSVQPSHYYTDSSGVKICFPSIQHVANHQLSTPPVIQWRVQGGLAEGEITYHLITDSTHQVIHGNFTRGFIEEGTLVEYYNNGLIRMSGQFKQGVRHGPWRWYNRVGMFHRLVEYERGDIVFEREHKLDFEASENLDEPRVGNIEDFPLLGTQNSSATYEFDCILPLERRAEFPGGQDSLLCFIESRLDRSLVEDQRPEGVVWVYFRIGETGSLESIEVNSPVMIKKRTEGYFVVNQVILDHVFDVFSQMPQWEYQEGDKPCMLFFSLKFPYEFRCDE